jgi:hypothetical protein
VDKEVTEEVASKITINKNLSKMGKGISEALLALEVTEAATEEAMTDKPRPRESILMVNSRGEVMNEAEVIKGATEEKATFKENKILSSGIVEAEAALNPKEMVMTSKSLAPNAPIVVIKIASLTRAVANTMARFVITTDQAFAEGVKGVVIKNKIKLINKKYPQK